MPSRAALASPARDRTRAAGESSRAIQRRTTGSAVVQMSKSGSIRRATPSTVTMVFCSSTSSGRIRMSYRAVTSKSWVSRRLMEISRAGRPNTGSPTARRAWAKAAGS